MADNMLELTTDFELFMNDPVNIRVLVANADNKTYRKRELHKYT